MFAEEIRRRRAKPSRRWHVDDHGIILDVLVTERRNKEAARQFFERLLGSYERPTKVTTNRLRSYKSVVREEAPKTKHLRGKWLNNRAENSHLPVREREKRLKKFKSPPQAQNFLNRFEFIRSYTKPMHHLIGAERFRRTIQRRLKEWGKISLIPLTA